MNPLQTKSVSGDLDRVLATAESLASITPEVEQAAARRALASVRRLVVRFLLQKYRSSGIQTRTGKLEQALRAVVVEARTGKEGVVGIVVRMPAGESAYKNKGGGRSNPYAAWGALNYGAVRAGQVVRATRSSVVGSTAGSGARTGRMSALGQKAKKSIKNDALGKKALSSRAVEAIERDIRVRGRMQRRGFGIGTKSRVGEKSVSYSGGAVVIRPKAFWNLSDTQKKEISDLFIRLYMEELLRLVGRKAA